MLMGDVCLDFTYIAGSNFCSTVSGKVFFLTLDH